MAIPNVNPNEVSPTALVGVSGQFTSDLQANPDSHLVIPRLWDQLMEKTGHALSESHWAVGVMSEVEGSPKMNYLAAVRLEDNGDQSVGLETLDLPGGSYLACEHVGSLATLGETTAWFYSQYLPSSGVQLRDGYHLEIYDERFDPDSDNTTVLICAPV